MTPHRPTHPELAEAKRVLSRALRSSGVTGKGVAAALGVSQQHVDHMLNHHRTHMRVADLLRLSKQPDMCEFVQQVLAALYTNVSQQHLRVCDLDAMSTTSPDAARAALATVAGRLWPQIGPVTSQIPDGVENGTDTASATDSAPVRGAGTIAATSTTRQRGSVAARGGRGDER